MSFLQEFIKNTKLILFLILTYAIGSLAIAYGFEYRGVQPCPMCLYQRYIFFVLAFSSGSFYFFFPDPRALLMCAGGFFLSFLVALTHVSIEQHFIESTMLCPSNSKTFTIEDLRALLYKTAPHRCDQVPWSFLGISMAGYNAILSLIISVGCVWVFKKQR